jgi:phosphocarrier protein
MTKVTARIRNEAGIHCRPSAAIVKEAMLYAGTILVSSSSGTCDVKSIMGLLALGLGPDEEITIEVSGAAEKEFAAKLKRLFETHFDFPPRAPGQDTTTLIAEPGA